MEQALNYYYRRKDKENKEKEVLKAKLVHRVPKVYKVYRVNLD